MKKSFLKNSIILIAAALLLCSALLMVSCGEEEPEYVDATNYLEFTSYNNGTCYISGVNKAYIDRADTEVSSYLAIPEKSPEGDIVVKIGENVFAAYENLIFLKSGIKLEGVTIPEGVAEIEKGAFADTSLKSVAFPSTMRVIGDKAFAGCGVLESVSFAEGLAEIGDEAFLNTDIRSLTIPNSVTAVGDKAFYGCSFLMSPDNFNLGTGLRKIGSWAFGAITAEGPYSENGALYIDNYLYHVDFNTLSAGEFKVKDGTIAVADNALEASNITLGEKITSIIIPESVKSIGDNAFYNMRNIDKIYIPSGVEQIGGSILALKNQTGNPNVQVSKYPYIFFGGTEEQWEALSPFVLLEDSDVQLIKSENVVFDVPMKNSSSELVIPNEDTP